MDVTDNTSQYLRNVTISLIVLETLFVSLSLVTRFLQKTLSGPDLWLIIISYSLCIVNSVLSLVQIQVGGTGQHFIVVFLEDREALVRWAKLDLAIIYTNLLSMTLPRLAILCLYWRLFKPVLYRRVIWAVGISLVIYWLAFTIASSVICHPYAAYWNPTIKNGHCGDRWLALKVATIPNVIVDLVMMVLPIPMIWKLQMSKHQKIGFTITFLTGSLGTIFAFIRLYYFWTYDLGVDPTYRSVTWLSWTLVESAMYLIAATLPPLRALPRHIRNSTAFTFCHLQFSRISKRNSKDVSDTTLRNTGTEMNGTEEEELSEITPDRTRKGLLSSSDLIQDSLSDLNSIREEEGNAMSLVKLNKAKIEEVQEV